MHEINEAAEVITTAVSPDANIIFGATIDEDLGDDIVITVIATGFDSNYFGSRGGESNTQIITANDGYRGWTVFQHSFPNAGAHGPPDRGRLVTLCQRRQPAQYFQPVAPLPDPPESGPTGPAQSK